MFILFLLSIARILGILLLLVYSAVLFDLCFFALVSGVVRFSSLVSFTTVALAGVLHLPGVLVLLVVALVGLGLTGVILLLFSLLLSVGSSSLSLVSAGARVGSAYVLTALTSGSSSKSLLL
jgi:hypothetical protein